jgi:cyclopropane-fatty-acyl-phospholipid synthase
VTEHLPDYSASLEQYRRLLKPGGRLYLDACASRIKYPFSSFTYRIIFPGNATPLCLHDYLAEVAKTPFELLEVHNQKFGRALDVVIMQRTLQRARTSDTTTES